MPTHYRGSRQEVSALNLFISLMRAADGLFKLQDKVVQPFGLKPSSFGALEALWHLGPMCQKELSQKLFSSEGNITQICMNLERQGLIERKKGERDKRFVILHLTARGSRLIQQVFQTFLIELVTNVDVLIPDEQIKLTQLCKKLGLQDSKEVPATDILTH